MHARLFGCLIVLSAAPTASADDLFVGVFESESRENWGTSEPGEYRIEVVSTAPEKYEATIFHHGEFVEKKDLIVCPIEREDYLRKREPGRAALLCTNRYGTLGAVLTYVENGVHVAVVKQKYMENPKLVKEEGLEPGDPSLFEARYVKAQYYARVSAFMYGFRKIPSVSSAER